MGCLVSYTLLGVGKTNRASKYALLSVSEGVVPLTSTQPLRPRCAFSLGLPDQSIKTNQHLVPFGFPVFFRHLGCLLGSYHFPGWL